MIFIKCIIVWGKFDFNVFPRSVKNSITVCDIIEIEGRERQTQVIEKMKKGGFRDCKKYHMWECMGIKFAIPSFRKYEIIDDKGLERLSNVYTIFDEYSDMLPVKRMFKTYVENRYTFSLFKKGKYDGSQIYNVEGHTATGEFVYAIDKGKGSGGVLLMKLIEKCFEEHKVNKLYVWIADDNIQSIETHKSAGFTRIDQYKVTLINGEI